MTFCILLALSWVACGVLNYGWVFAFFQREFPISAPKHRRGDRSVAFLFAVGGPIGFFVIVLLRSYRHGWSLTCPELSTQTEEPR